VSLSSGSTSLSAAQFDSESKQQPGSTSLLLLLLSLLSFCCRLLSTQTVHRAELRVVNLPHLDVATDVGAFSSFCTREGELTGPQARGPALQLALPNWEGGLVFG
jgi:hypothetical protein